MEELALAAAFVIHRIRENARQHLPANLLDDGLDFAAQRKCEQDLRPSPWPAVPDIAVWNVDGQHLFEAHGLGAELEVGGVTVSHAGLVLNRSNAVVVADLDRIGPTLTGRVLPTRAGCRAEPCGLALGDALRCQRDDAPETP